MIKLYLIKKLVSDKDLSIWISWLNDPKVVKYSDKRFKKHTIVSQKKFLLKKIEDQSCYIFQIKLKSKFIGVIELSSVKFPQNECEISYMIGEKNLHGKGLGTQAIKNCLRYAKKILNIKIVYAGINSENIESKKVLKKNFFNKVGNSNKYYLLKNNNDNNNNLIVFQKYLK